MYACVYYRLVYSRLAASCLKPKVEAYIVCDLLAIYIQLLIITYISEYWRKIGRLLCVNQKKLSNYMKSFVVR